MEQVQEFFQTHIIETMLIIGGILLLLVITNINLMFKTSNMEKRYKKLLNGRERINLERLLIDTGEEINFLKDKMIVLQEKTDELYEKMPYNIQKVGFIRYNAFGAMGPDLSFSFALLNDLGDGFVFTSIYEENHPWNYAKPINNGKSEYPLSVEEMQAIDRARLGGVSIKI